MKKRRSRSWRDTLKDQYSETNTSMVLAVGVGVAAVYVTTSVPEEVAPFTHHSVTLGSPSSGKTIGHVDTTGSVHGISILLSYRLIS